MKKLIIIYILALSTISIFAQDTTLSRRDRKEAKRTEKQQRQNTLSRQEEEGVLSYTKQSAFGLQLRTNGYGAFYELTRRKSPRFSNSYAIEITEIKHQKEEKLSSLDGFFSNAFIYGKVNNFYQLKFSYGQQYIFGQKGNKNGVAVIGLYQGGLSLGLLRPYYLQVDDDGDTRTIKYEDDSTLFVSGDIRGAGGFGKGWSEIKVKPGAFIKTAMRFDFGRYNESVQAIEIGLSVEAYAQKIQLMLNNDTKQLFFQGHLAFVFGRRK
ncbi:MAG: hypothetical protein ABR502_07610 [Chitinophagaceae bacterium]